MSAVRVQQPQRKQQPQVRPKHQVRKKLVFKLTVFEKLVLGLFITLVIFAGVFVVSRQAALYSTTKDIQHLNASIQDQEKMNNDMYVKVQQLSTYDRILEKAKAFGMQLDEKNVKVVQQ